MLVSLPFCKVYLFGLTLAAKQEMQDFVYRYTHILYANHQEQIALFTRRWESESLPLVPVGSDGISVFRAPHCITLNFSGGYN